ncbi:MAG: pirin family protein [Bacteriovoracaceae bacterium]
MMLVRKSDERGYADHGWLKSHHSFSFASYYDPRNMGFRTLRVINDDIIEGGGGFPTHPHNDMEIITYVLEGELAHKDTMGNTSVIKPHEVQIMTAGTGIAHSEFNNSKDKRVHLLQIWIQSDKTKHTPAYGQKSFEEDVAKQPLTLVVSNNGEAGSLTIHQDAKLYVGKLKGNESINFPLSTNRHCWVHLIDGELTVGGKTLHAGDAAGFTNESELIIDSTEASHFLVFDLA